MSNDTTFACATTRFVRVIPMKARRVLDIVHGRFVDEVLNILEYAPQGAVDPVAKVVVSAAVNAENNFSLDRRTLAISEAYVNGGPIMKRFRPRAQGYVFHVRKRISHTTVVVESQKEGGR